MSVTLSLFAGAGWQFFDNNGVPLAGGLIYTYAAGTSTPQATYTTSAGNVAHSNPIVLDSAGRVATGEVWVTSTSTYKFVLKTSAGVEIGTYDNIIGTSTAADVLFTQFGTGAVTRTVQSKLREWVSITDFGASTSAVDNAAYIQAAINAVSAIGGGEVFIPEGSFNTGAIIILDKVSLVGVGNASKLVAITGSYDFISGNAVTNVRISDFYVDCTLMTGSSGMYFTGIQDSEVSGVTIYNAAGFGWLIFGSVRCKYLRNTINTTRQWDGMTISTGSTDNVIEGNIVYNSYDSGIGFTDTIGTVCVGNYVKRQKISGNWAAPGIDAAGAKNATITGNYVIGNKFGVSLLQHPNSGKQCKRIAVTGNTIADGQYGILAGPVAVIPPATSENVPRDGIVISGNTIFSQDVAGIAMVGEAIIQQIENSIVGNVISYCATGISLDTTYSTSVLSNQIAKNTTGINTFGTSNVNLSMFGNMFVDNGTAWTGSAGTGTTYIFHNKGLGTVAGTLDHDKFVGTWDFPGHLYVGSINFWQNGSTLYYKDGTPSSATDGTAVTAVPAYTSAWNGATLFTLGAYYLWVDSSGRLRIKNGAPTSDTDGTIVGTQT